MRFAGRRRDLHGRRPADAGAGEGRPRPCRVADRRRYRPAPLGRPGSGPGRRHRFRRGAGRALVYQPLWLPEPFGDNGSEAGPPSPVSHLEGDREFADSPLEEAVTSELVSEMPISLVTGKNTGNSAPVTTRALI